MNLKNLYNKYKDVIPYLFFGVCTTLINVIAYWLMAHPFNIGTMLSTLVAWFIAVVFAYVTNRKWVFCSKANSRKEKLEEFGSFFACRIGTGIIDWIIMFLFVDIIGFNDVIIKFFANVIVIVLNYIASKFIIFNRVNLFNKIKKTFKSKKTRRKYIIRLCLGISFLIISFLFLIKSPLHIWNNSISGTDSSVFRTIAMQIENGLVPYKDTFDHKGPLLYFINFLGSQMSFSNGIWFIEFISLFITLCYMYKIARLKCNRIFSVTSVFLALSLLYKYFEGGNLVEEYAMPFITFSLYIFLDYLINKKVNKFRLILCGLSLGCILLLRPNMIAVWVVFCIIIFIDILYKRKYKVLLNFILYFIIGLVIVILPFIVWLGLNSSLSDFWYCYIKFNTLYSSSIGGRAFFFNKWSSYIYFLNEPLIIFSIVILIYLFIVERKKIYLYNVLIFALSLLFICLSGMKYLHYGMVLVPLIIFPFSCLFKLISENKNSSKVMSLVCLLFSYNFILPDWFKIIESIPIMYDNRYNKNIKSEVIEISNIIKENSKENDLISVYGNLNSIYVYSKRLPATKYSYQFPIGKIAPEILYDYFIQISNEKPSIIVVQKNMYDDLIEQFINKNKYKLLWKNNKEISNSTLIYILSE